LPYSSKLIIFYRASLPHELWPNITKGLSIRDLYNVSKVSSSLRGAIVSLPIWNLVAKEITPKPQKNPFVFILKKVKSVCDNCHKVASMAGSKKLLRMYSKEYGSYQYCCLGCRKQYYLDSPESFEYNSLMQGTVTKTQASKIYKLNATVLDQAIQSLE
jgi:hypothetical protein